MQFNEPMSVEDEDALFAKLHKAILKRTGVDINLVTALEVGNWAGECAEDIAQEISRIARVEVSDTFVVASLATGQLFTNLARRLEDRPQMNDAEQEVDNELRENIADACASYDAEYGGSYRDPLSIIISGMQHAYTRNHGRKKRKPLTTPELAKALAKLSWQGEATKSERATVEADMLQLLNKPDATYYDLLTVHVNFAGKVVTRLDREEDEERARQTAFLAERKAEQQAQAALAKKPKPKVSKIAKAFASYNADLLAIGKIKDKTARDQAKQTSRDVLKATLGDLHPALVDFVNWKD